MAPGTLCGSCLCPLRIAAQNQVGIFAQILGHAEDDLKTSLSYMVLALGDDETAIERAKAEVQRLLDAVRNQMNEEKAAKRAAGNLVEDDDDDDVVIANEDMD